MGAMSAIGATVRPDPALWPYHDAKYAVFRRMTDDQKAYREIMGG